MLYLFDIDGTLLRTGGAGRAAMNAAFSEAYGIPDAFDGIDFRGSLDSVLLDEVLALRGLPRSAEVTRAFQARYVSHLRARLSPPMGPGQERCPGVPHLLTRLAGRGRLGVVTGNWRRGAVVKLGAFGLASHFRSGAYGEDAPTREALVPIAIRRARRAGWRGNRVVMIGDTPSDVMAARAAGAVAVAVMTGWCTESEIVAAHPDLLLQDLEAGAEALLGL